MPRAVAPRADVERLVESARAELDALAIELQDAVEEADAAEATARDARSEVDPLRLDLFEIVRTAVAERLATRRAELTVEVEVAWEQAARVVATARVEADAIRGAGETPAQKRPAALTPQTAHREERREGQGDGLARRLLSVLLVDVLLPLLIVVLLIGGLLLVLG